MKSDLILQEDGFCLQFISGDDDVYKVGSPVREELIADENVYVLQEMIIVPPPMINEANKFLAMSVAPQRCNRPLILIGHSDLPVQYAAVIAKKQKNKTIVVKNDTGIKIVTDKINLLYSAPILCRKIKDDNIFIDAFFRISEILDLFQMKESEIARTWLFMRDILNDYEAMNTAREKFFAKWHTAASHFLPASTGIQNRMAGNEILAFEFCAFSGNSVVIRQVSSPLQNEPTNYGKLFSRAVIIEFPRSKLLFISGTASIDKTGTSVYVGDFKGQMEFTLEIISAIMRQFRCDFSNIVQAAIYLKREKDMNQCLNIIDHAGFPRDRSLFQVGVDVCRDDLLCEIEATAIIT
ncbi:putative translation initiation inhibitor [hydrocarbon metagenome]|uniref:Putative translation initiation inhibitor n=1 Tax=hydrocarbon metagenome TaxID=938273 RepID=A0A0W8FPJ5_9ZZZZ